MNEASWAYRHVRGMKDPVQMLLSNLLPEYIVNSWAACCESLPQKEVCGYSYALLEKLRAGNKKQEPWLRKIDPQYTVPISRTDCGKFRSCNVIYSACQANQIVANTVASTTSAHLIAKRSRPFWPMALEQASQVVCLLWLRRDAVPVKRSVGLRRPRSYAMKFFSIQEPLDNQCKDTDDDGRYPKRDGAPLDKDRG